MFHPKSILFACALAAASLPASALATAPALTGKAVVPKTAQSALPVPPADRVRGGGTSMPINAPTLDPPGRGTTVTPTIVDPPINPLWPHSSRV